MSDLKQCPFCGSEAVLNHGHMITATGQYLANVKCSECGIATRVVWSTDSPEEAVKEAIEAWNRRAEPEPKWIPFTMRELTTEEKEEHPEWDCIMDCKLPDDYEEILVSDGKYVWFDTFYNDGDGCCLESDRELDDCAWMPLPKPYGK